MCGGMGGREGGREKGREGEREGGRGLAQSMCRWPSILLEWSRGFDLQLTGQVRG